VHRIVDLKAPGSGECARNRLENLPLLGLRDQLKFVLADRDDYVWARELIVGERLATRVAEVLLSPVHGELDPRSLVAWTLEDGLRVRVQLQLHKYIWGRDVQGV
jgi:7-carboxy-7-deazaguanine synthase